MKKILAIGGSNSQKSINKTFANFVANKVENSEVITIDLNDFELPLYGPDLQSKIGIPENAHRFYNLINESDGIVLSLAEYNGMITSAFKNLWDWASRIEMKIWQSKPVFLMATSPGGRGGAMALQTVNEIMPFYGGNITAQFSLPRFHENFSDDGLVNNELESEFKEQLTRFQLSLN